MTCVSLADYFLLVTAKRLVCMTCVSLADYFIGSQQKAGSMTCVSGLFSLVTAESVRRTCMA